MAELEEMPHSLVDKRETRVFDKAQAYDFRAPALLSPGDLSRLRAHQEEFARGAAARLSIYLGAEFSLKLTGVKTVSCQGFAESWSRPAHLSLFKMEPLRGVSVLEVSPQLGLCMVDRLMGGPGQVASTDQELTEIEKVLLEQSMQLLLNEWCDRWARLKELKPVVLGYESNESFIQTTPPETVMLVVSMRASFGECTGQIQMGFPYAAMEPLLQRLCKGTEKAKASAPTAPPAPAVALKWNPCFNDVRVPVKAEWEGLEMTTRQILALKVGDVLPLNAQHAQQLNVRVADMIKFQGRPGTLAGQWAVQLTQAINR
jgi:flagellar motor switch protein FliM